MASNSSTLLLLLLLISSTISFAANKCSAPSRGECYDKPKALKLKLIAIATILISSMIGVCLPLFTRSVSALSPDRNLFALVKAFASSVILATGYMHVLPDSFDNLNSPCLPESPWRKFPFTAFVGGGGTLIQVWANAPTKFFFTISPSRRKYIIETRAGGLVK